MHCPFEQVTLACLDASLPPDPGPPTPPPPQVTLADGRTFLPGQGNNAYIFPGVGLGAIASQALTITDEDLYVAAISLSQQVGPLYIGPHVDPV